MDDRTYKARTYETRERAQIIMRAYAAGARLYKDTVDSLKAEFVAGKIDVEEFEQRLARRLEYDDWRQGAG